MTRRLLPDGRAVTLYDVAADKNTWSQGPNTTCSAKAKDLIPAAKVGYHKNYKSENRQC